MQNLFLLMQKSIFIGIIMLIFSASLNAQHRIKCAFLSRKDSTTIKYLKTGRKIQVWLKTNSPYETVYVYGKLMSVDGTGLAISFSSMIHDYFKTDLTMPFTYLDKNKIRTNSFEYYGKNDSIVLIPLSSVDYISRRYHAIGVINATAAISAFGAAFLIAPLISANYSKRTLNGDTYFDVFYPSLITVGGAILMGQIINSDKLDRDVIPIIHPSK